MPSTFIEGKSWGMMYPNYLRGERRSPDCWWHETGCCLLHAKLSKVWWG